MKLAWSKKNAWEKAPAWVRAAAGPLMSRIPVPWLLGRAFRRHRRFVAQVDRWPAQRAREYQVEQLRRICLLAQARSEFYRRQFQQAGFEAGDLKSPEDLSGLPVIDKRVVVDNLEAMCTEAPDGPGIDFVSTGGSSGLPLRFYAPASRSAVEFAYLVACWERAGYQLGMPTAVLRGQIVKSIHNGMRHEYDPLLRRHYYSNFHTAPEELARYLAHIAGLGPCALMAYPTSATMLARFASRQGDKAPHNIRVVLMGSENVYPFERQIVEQVFGCRVMSWYGHSEKLVLASECECASAYHVWPTYGYCELLDEAGQPVRQVGQRGEIVGTGFINHIVPLIRYRTGDFARYVGQRCSACGREQMLLEDIEGRYLQSCLLAADGSAISAVAFNVHDETFNNVEDYQFHQSEAGKATLWVVASGGLSPRQAEKLLANVNGRLQGQVRVDLRCVESLVVTERGKKPRIISTVKGGENAPDSAKLQVR
jgi:phenylacetate-CoA ligase